MSEHKSVRNQELAERMRLFISQLFKTLPKITNRSISQCVRETGLSRKILDRVIHDPTYSPNIDIVGQFLNYYGLSLDISIGFKLPTDITAYANFLEFLSQPKVTSQGLAPIGKKELRELNKKNKEWSDAASLFAEFAQRGGKGDVYKYNRWYDATECVPDTVEVMEDGIYSEQVVVTLSNGDICTDRYVRFRDELDHKVSCWESQLGMEGEWGYTQPTSSEIKYWMRIKKV